MNNSMKSALAAVALAAPLVLGVAYTAGASVGDGGDGEGGSHGVDQWTLEEGDSGEYTLDREETDGVVTLVVTGPDGTVVGVDAMPEFVRAAADDFGADDWEPDEVSADSPFEFVDGTPCYDADKVADLDSPDEAFGYLDISDNTTQGVERFEDGRFEAAYFDRAISQDEITSVVDDNGSYFDLDGAQVLEPCN